MSIVIEGSVGESAGGRDAEGRIGSLVVKPAGTMHRNRFGSAGAVLLSIADAPSCLFDRLGWTWFEDSGQAPAALKAAIALRAGDPFGAAQESAWRMLAATGLGGPAPSRATAAPWLAKVKDQVAGAGARPSISRLANAAGVHPVYLTRMFRKSFGCSISGFIRRLRVQRGADLLARTDLQVSAIAAELGFADQSHFCRAFRAEIGVAPSVYRSAMRPARPSARDRAKSRC